MLSCDCVLVSYLLTATLILNSFDGLQATPVTSKCQDLAVAEDSRSRGQTVERVAGKRSGAELTTEQARSSVETRRQRLFPGANAPLDRMSVGKMEKRGKKRKEVDSLRKRVSAPIDRIGIGRLPRRFG